MNLSSLSNNDLIESLLTLRGKEREVTLQILFHLNELERRGIYRELGYSSLFDYCTRKLGYSEASAYRRISGARSISEHPELAEHFIEGRVSLCTISLAAKSLKAKETEVFEILNKSAREVQLLVAKHVPVMIPKETIKPVVIEKSETATEERYKLQFSVTKETYERLTEAKNRLSNSLGNRLSVEAVLDALLKNYLKVPERKARGISSVSRYISRSTKLSVYSRDGGQCTYVADDGTRCCERKYLHYDHVRPYALGGDSDTSNLRLLCAAHNRLMAERVFG